ncbi:MAG: hypothetical protein JRH20_26970 [Deltaproteobacteria bacterium]|nr:hypothetical protein [Deltaproteobacteria bacterium]
MALFSDLIAALGKVTSGLKALASLPRVERAKYRQVMDDTYRLIDTALNMVIIRLGDIQSSDDDREFLREVTNLDNYGDWIQAEREFRLCKSLRAAVRETQTLSGTLAGVLSTADWHALVQQMEAVLASEAQVAAFIGDRFRELADSARAPAASASELGDIKNNIRAVRDELLGEREELIRQEIELYSLV